MGKGDTHYKRRMEQLQDKKPKFSAAQIHALVNLNMEMAKENREAMDKNKRLAYQHLTEYWDQREALAQKGYPMGIFAEYKQQRKIKDESISNTSEE